MIDVVFYHQSIKHPMRRGLGEAGSIRETARLLELALASVARHMPQARPVLITGDATPIVAGIAIERRPLNDPAELQLDRTRAYRDFVSARVGLPGGALFLDTDILLMGDAGTVFEQSFDIALTYVEEATNQRPGEVDHWGLPTDGRLSAINFGVMATRYSPGAAAFLAATLDRFDAIAAEGRAFLAENRNVFSGYRGRYRVADVRTWGGGQFAMSSLLSSHLFRQPIAERAQVGSSDVLLLPAARWNYTPPDDLAEADFSACRIAHFKGPKKHWMATVARRHGYVVP